MGNRECDGNKPKFSLVYTFSFVSFSNAMTTFLRIIVGEPMEDAKARDTAQGQAQGQSTGRTHEVKNTMLIHAPVLYALKYSLIEVKQIVMYTRCRM